MLSSILIFLTISTLAASQDSGSNVVFVANPANVTAANGTYVTFQCAVTSDSAIESIVFYSNKVHVLAMNGNAADGYTNRILVKTLTNEDIAKLLPEGSPTPKFVKGYNLTLSPLLPEYNGYLYCKTDFNHSSVYAYITVLTPPKKPVLSSSVAASNWMENQMVIFTCSSGEGNPFSSITVDWLYSGKLIFPPDGVPLLSGVASTTTKPTIAFGDFKSDLSLSLTPPLFGGVISCRITHNNPPDGQTWTFESDGLTLKFKYGPYMKVTITSAIPPVDLITLPTNRIKVLEKSNLVLNCSLDAYPLPNSTEKVSWSHNDITQPGSVLDLKDISRTSSGVYSCHTNEGVTFTENNFTLDVLYPPSLKFPPNVTDSTFSVLEGSSLNFSFIVEANPFPDPDDFQWSSGSKVYPKGQYLRLGQATRDMTGYYTCKVNSTMIPFDSTTATVGASNMTIRITVNYAPGGAKLVSNKQSAYVQGEVNFTCTVFGSDANSDMSVVWIKDDVVLPVASTSMSWSDSSTFVANLVLNKVTNQNRGSYKCRGKNRAGEGNTSAPANFEVYDVPSLISFTPNKNLLEPSEGEILPAIECVVSGQPKPIIKWVKNNHDVDPAVYNTTTVASPTSDNQTSFIVSSSFEMKRPLVAADAGNYTCQATLLNGDTMSMRAILVAVKQQPIFTDPLMNITADLNRTAYLRCQCYAYPIPDLTWYKDGKPFEISKDQEPGSWRWVNDTRNNWLLIHESNVAIRGVLKTDEGRYTCHAENSIGYTNRTTYLTVKTPPEPPTINSPITATWESIDLSWTPGSDGGYPQTYRIFYYVKGGNYNVSNPALLGSGLDGIINVTEGTTYNIKGLLPGKTYVVRVTGINLLGISRDAPDQKTEIQVNTTEYPVKPITGVTYVERNTAIYFSKVPSDNGDLCVYLRTDNQSSPSALNFTCRDVGAGQYEYAVRIPTERYKWVASFCLQRRNDVCGPASPVEIDSRPISTESAVALGVVCSLVFLVLVGLVVVLVLWCRQRKDDEDSTIPPAHLEKPANLRRWSHLGQNRDSSSDLKKQRRLVSDSVSSKDSDKLCFESGTMSSSCVELNKSASERGSHGFKNKVFYCDSSNALELTDQLDSSSGQQGSTDKVYHEVVV